MLDNPLARAAEARRTINPMLKFALELGPLALFFIAYWTGRRSAGRGEGQRAHLRDRRPDGERRRHARRLLCAAAAHSDHAAGHRDHRRHLRLADALFPQRDASIKIKPTVLYRPVRRRFVRRACGSTGRCCRCCSTARCIVTPEGWRKLTWRWAFFFLALAVLNEIVWRTQTDSLLGRFQDVRRHCR